jgi:L-lactate dehydrogenase
MTPAPLPPRHGQGRSKSSSSLTTGGYSPEDILKEHFASLNLESSVEPIPFTEGAIEDTVSNQLAKNARKFKKVSIVGCGQVGMAIAYSILNQEIAGCIALVDIDEEKLEGEAKDLRQGSAFHQRVRVEASSDYSITEDSHLVIITAGVAQKVGESRLSLVERNVRIMKFIMPEVLKHSPESPICIVSNPCDIMTAVAAKIAGPSVPPGRIFGSGTCLDSSRLRSLIAMALDVDSRSVHGYIIGEHGDSSIAVFSGVRVGGVPLLDHGEKPTEAHFQMHREVVESAGDVIAKKGFTN